MENYVKQILVQSLIIFLALINVLKAEGLCEKCSCNFKEITPFIDCSNLNIESLDKIAVPRRGLKTRTFDIDFESNQIQEIHKIIPKVSVERLSFRSNNISRIIDGAFSKLVYLSTLDLSHNNLQELTREVFLGPQKPGKGAHSPLLSLDLSFNRFESFKRTDFEHLFNLEDINFSGNPLQIVDSHPTSTAIGSLSRLIFLNLSETGISTLPRHFLKGLLHLQSIDVSKNQFKVIPSEIHYDGHELKHLKMDENPIDILKSHSFGNMIALQTLSLCKMPHLAYIHEAAFSGLRNLTVLKIDNNPDLGFIDPDAFTDFQYPLVLKYLSLSNNFLRYLPENLLPELKNVENASLEFFKINGNQWECNCHNQWLIDLLNHEKFQENAKSATCTRPSDLKGVNFLDAKIEELPCEHKEAFDATKHDFGLPHPSPKFNIGESRIVSLTIALGCILAIIISVLFVAVLYLKQKRKITYDRLSGFKIHFQRRETPESIRSSQSSMANSIYQDNPTTMPVES